MYEKLSFVEKMAKSCSKYAQFSTHSITTKNSPNTLHFFWAIGPNPLKLNIWDMF